MLRDGWWDELQAKIVSVLFPFVVLLFFFFNDTATTEIYTLSLHDALPIWIRAFREGQQNDKDCQLPNVAALVQDR